MALTLYLAFLLWFFLIFPRTQSVEFIFNGFNESQTILTTMGASIIKPNGALRLTNRTQNAIGHAFYSAPIQMIDNTSSFNTSFVFAIVPSSSGRGGFGLAFTLTPDMKLSGAGSEHYMGIFNPSNDGNLSNHIFAVEFDTVNGFNDKSDTVGNHVGININSMVSVKLEPAVYYVNDTKEEMFLESGDPIQAWIEYDGVAEVVNVTIAPFDQEKPIIPLISHRINLTDYLLDTMYVGFSASTGEKSSSHYILGWSFSMNGTAPPLNLSQLPKPPTEKDPSSFKPPIVALIAALSAVTFLLFGMLALFTINKRKQFEDLEDWELDCPHRFRYKDLYAATKGFKESEVIGSGGFGIVYKGVLPSTGCEIAVKKIGRNSIQGMREFAAEIESLGRVRHKNMVNLQGWCKKKDDLLLVYDFIPNGSLDSLLFNSNNNVLLSWEQRFNIIKGIAAGLLYLHEEWEKVVIHRDVKSSNVLIDAYTNARLGDFGLARLYDHGILSHTTNVVGTIGYIAPELARTGQACARTDVFAFGVLLIEVATGRRPIGSGQFILVDWVLEFHHLGQILDVVDPKLNASYVVEEMELVLGLGLLCSHQKPEVRPTMRQVMRYLNRDDILPVIDDWGSVSSRFLEVIPFDMITSYRSSSIGGISSSSLLDTGR